MTEKIYGEPVQIDYLGRFLVLFPAPFELDKEKMDVLNNVFGDVYEACNNLIESGENELTTAFKRNIFELNKIFHVPTYLLNSYAGIILNPEDTIKSAPEIAERVLAELISFNNGETNVTKPEKGYVPLSKDPEIIKKVMEMANQDRKLYSIAYELKISSSVIGRIIKENSPKNLTNTL